MAKAKSEKFTGPLMSEEKANRAADIWMFITMASLLSMQLMQSKTSCRTGATKNRLSCSVDTSGATRRTWHTGFWHARRLAKDDC